MPYWNTETGHLRPLTVKIEAARMDEQGNRLSVEVVEVPADEDGEPRMTRGPEGGDVYDTEAEPTWIDDGDVGARVLSPFQVRVSATLLMRP